MLSNVSGLLILISEVITVLFWTNSLPNKISHISTRILRAARFGHRSHERLVAIDHMRQKHVQMALVDRHICWLADGPARMVQIFRHIAQFHKFLKISQSCVRRPPSSVAHERRPYTGAVTRDLPPISTLRSGLRACCTKLRWRRVAQQSDVAKAAWESVHAFALNIRACFERQRAKAAGLSAKFTPTSSRIGFRVGLRLFPVSLLRSKNPSQLGILRSI